MTGVKLTFSLPLGAAVHTLRFIVDHLLTLVGVTEWRWEFDNGAVKEIIRGPFVKAVPEVFQIPQLPLSVAEQLQTGVVWRYAEP